jgi:hypothetical protein
MPILNKDSKCVLPHLLFSSYQEIVACLEQCNRNRSLLRYFDVDEIVRFIEYVCNHNYIEDVYKIPNYFTKIEDITMDSIKFYYLEVLKRLDASQWTHIYDSMKSTQKVKFSHLDPHFTHSKSMGGFIPSPVPPINTNNNNNLTPKSGKALTRMVSVQYTPPPPPLQEILQPLPVSNSRHNGILITTTDAHTLTDGPTIFLAENVELIGRFYIQQSNIPMKVFERIMEKIEKNNMIQHKIELQSRNLEDKLGKENEKEKKSSKEDAYKPEVKNLMALIDTLRSEIQMIQLDSVFVPNTKCHQQLWVPENGGKLVENAFVPTIDEEVVKQIMEIDVSNDMKLLLLMGIGMFVKDVSPRYTEIMKKMAYEQKLYLILASSDYIYGTNYQFAHCFLGKDLLKMTQQKIIQAMGRVGRTNIQQTYTIRFRDDIILSRLFLPVETNQEAVVMNRLFCSS